MIKTILISQIPLPYHKIGSWSTMYRNYLEGNHQIDIIICEMPQVSFKNVFYSFVSQNILTKVKGKLFRNKKIGYLQALEKIVQQKHKYIIQIVDNSGLVLPLQKFLEKNGLRQKCYIQYFYHGFDPFYSKENEVFYSNSIDEIIFLTDKAHNKFKSYYTKLPKFLSVLHNGIDTQKFTKINTLEKEKLRKKLNIAEQNVFLWCSQDRPKKGLEVVLEAWRKIDANTCNSRLLVVGADRKEDIQNVTFIGKVPNDDLPQYYQISDVYLFPTLCPEGFGMSLAEALNCGCYCMASENGGVNEVLQNGKLGKLIKNPNDSANWTAAIKSYLTNKDERITIEKPVYTIEEWQTGMNSIITKAKANFS